jgi:hypothetical protein
VSPLLSTLVSQIGLWSYDKALFALLLEHPTVLLAKAGRVLGKPPSLGFNFTLSFLWFMLYFQVLSLQVIFKASLLSIVDG